MHTEDRCRRPQWVDTAGNDRPRPGGTDRDDATSSSTSSTIALVSSMTIATRRPSASEASVPVAVSPPSAGIAAWSNSQASTCARLRPPGVDREHARGGKRFRQLTDQP